VILLRRHPLWVGVSFGPGSVSRARRMNPSTVANYRAGCGFRYQYVICSGCRATPARKAHQPTLFTGSSATYTENPIDVPELLNRAVTKAWGLESIHSRWSLWDLGDGAPGLPPGALTR